MKQLSLSAFVLLSLATSNHAASKEIQLHAQSPAFGYFLESPLDQITGALNSNPNVTRFRCSWDDTLGSGWDRGTILYDKKRALLKYYDVGGAGEMGEEFYRVSLLFTNVKSATLRAIISKYKVLAREDNQFYFSEALLKQGAHRYVLESYKRGY